MKTVCDIDWIPYSFVGGFLWETARKFHPVFSQRLNRHDSDQLQQTSYQTHLIRVNDDIYCLNDYICRFFFLKDKD